MMKQTTILTGLLLLISAYSASAQDFERFAPKPVPQETETPEVPAEVPAAVGEDDELVRELKGVVLVGAMDDVVVEGISVAGISAEGFEILQNEDFPQVIQPYLGQSLTMKSLNEMVRDIILYYRANDYPVVDVIVPEQDITPGTVQILIVEGTVGKVRVEGNLWFATKLLSGQVRIQSGERIKSSRLLKDLSWLNSNPFRSVNLVFAPGEELGGSDVVLRVEDRFPVRIYFGYEDTGSALIGEEQWVMGANWGNAFGLDHQLNYQYTADTDFQEIGAHSLSYVVPLPWRHTLTAFASFVETETVAGGFKLTGNSAQAGIRYTIPLPDIKTYRHEFFAGFDWKQSDSSLEFGVVPITANTTDIGQFLYGYRGVLPDSHGVSSLDVQVAQSPGGLFEHQSRADFSRTRASTDDEYTYMRLKFSRLTQLPWDLSLSNEFTWQVTDSRLLSSEQLGFGGYNSIRGYNERELSNTDEGWFLRNELRLPAFSVLQIFGNVFGSNWANDQLQLLAFWDYGIASSSGGRVTRSDGAVADRVYMSSVGPGLRYTVNNWLSVRADYGFQLIDTGNVNFASRLHLGVIVSY